LDQEELGSIGTIGHGSGFGSGYGILSGMHATNDTRQGFLNAAMRSALVACSVKSGDSASAVLESTLAEIVTVRDVATTPTRDAKVEGWIAEQLWGVTLPRQFDGDHDTWDVRERRQ